MQKKEYRNILSVFFSGLYKTKPVLEERIREYIKDILMLMCTSENRKVLNLTITTQETSQAVKNVKKDKTPGPDGLTAMYYKQLEEVLTKRLQKFVSKIREKRQYPQHGEWHI